MSPTLHARALSAALLVLLAALAAHVFVHFAPGAMSPDSLSILTQARSGVFEDGHPPLVTAAWRVLDRVIPGPAGMLLMHLSMFFGGLFLVFRACLPQHGYFVLPVALAVGLYPPLLGILGVIWIDITMAGLYLLALGVWLSILDSRHRLAGMVLVLLLTSLAIAVRHNAAAAAFPLLSLFLLRDARGGWIKAAFRAMAFGAMATVLLFLGSKWISAQFVDQPRHLWRAAALYDIAGASHFENRNLFHQGVLVRSSLEDINRLYSPRSYFPLMTGEQIHAKPGEVAARGAPLELDTTHPALGRQLLWNWVEVVVEHPGSYLRHRIEFFTSMVKRQPWGLWAPYFDAIYPNDLGVPQRSGTTSTELFSQVRSLSTSSGLFEPLPYLLLSGVLFVPVLALGIKLRDKLLQVAGALYASGTCHMAGLFLFAVTPDFRYSHWLLTSAAVATALLLLNLGRRTAAALRGRDDVGDSRLGMLRR